MQRKVTGQEIYQVSCELMFTIYVCQTSMLGIIIHTCISQVTLSYLDNITIQSVVFINKVLVINGKDTVFNTLRVDLLFF